MSVWTRGLIVAFALWSALASAGPISAVTETFHDWKERLFGKGHPVAEVVDAPAAGAIELATGHPVRLRLVEATPQHDFSKGRSRFREIVLPQTLAHAAVRVQVVAQRAHKGTGNTVFKPLLYVQSGESGWREPVEVKPLHLDIRPFRKTRLLGCVILDDVHKFALATDPSAIGKSYVSEVREAIKAPTKSGFYYSTDAIKARLPYAQTGVLILEVSAEKDADSGC